MQKEGCVQFVAITREKKERERERERERDPCFFRVVSFGSVLRRQKRETRRRANALTSSYNNKVIILI